MLGKEILDSALILHTNKPSLFITLTVSDDGRKSGDPELARHLAVFVHIDFDKDDFALLAFHYPRQHRREHSAGAAPAAVEVGVN